MRNIKFNSKLAKALICGLGLTFVVLVNIYTSFSVAVGIIFEFPYLAAATTVLATFTLQIVFFLQKSTGADVIEIATIQNIVINFKTLFISFACQALAFLLWGIHPLRGILLILYCSGGYEILKTLIRAIKWMLDWSNEPRTGFRDKQRRKLLNEPKLTVKQRKEVWEAWLINNIGRENDNGFISISSEDLIYIFSTNYKYLVGEDRSWMVKITFKYLNEDFSKTDHYNDYFLKYSMKTLLGLFDRLKEHEDNLEFLEELYAWKNCLNDAFVLIAKNGNQPYLLRLVIENNSQYVGNSDSIQFLAELILDFLYNLDVGLENSYSRDWKISYQALSSNTKHSLLINRLLNEFLTCLRKQRRDNNTTVSNVLDSYKNDEIFETLFESADPSFFNKLEILFGLSSFGIYDHEYIRVALLSPPLMGQIGKVSVINGSLSESQADSTIAAQHKKEIVETLKIGTLIYTELKTQKEFTEYSEELQQHLDALSQDSKRDSKLLANKIGLIKSTISEILKYKKIIWRS